MKRELSSFFLLFAGWNKAKKGKKSSSKQREGGH
jgi:hypothetical protein